MAYQAKYRRSWALIVGINDYHFASPLSYANSDANAVARLLHERFAFPDDGIVLLLDGTATREAIHQEFLKLTDGTRIDSDDRIVFFFAGHGHTVTGSRGEVGFLVPVDGKVDDLGTLVRWDELTRNADLIPAKHIFFMMDACYGGLALIRKPSFGTMRFMGDMLQRPARQVLTAGKANETVADGGGVRVGHSIFTAHLLNGLEGGSATQEGMITASGLMAYVYDRVARDQYSHQTPHYGFVDGDGDFIFDTTILDTLRSGTSTDGSGDSRVESKDILLNPSPSVVTQVESEAPVVERMKELLSDPTKRIKLDDYVSLHVRRFLDATDLRHFPLQSATPTKEEFATASDSMRNCRVTCSRS